MSSPLRLVVVAPSGSRSHPQRFICFYDFILSDLYVFPISSSAIYMFLRFHPRRFICFSDLILSDLYVFSDLILSDLYVFTISSSAIYMFFPISSLSDLYVFTISSSAIYMFFRSHPQIRPQGIDSRAMLLRAGPSCHICWAVLGSPGCSCVHC